MSPRRHDSRSDEDDVRVRPNRRGSRPRTRQRPAHADAVPGLVVAVDRGRMTVRIEGPDGGPLDVTARVDTSNPGVADAAHDFLRKVTELGAA